MRQAEQTYLTRVPGEVGVVIARREALLKALQDEVVAAGGLCPLALALDVTAPRPDQGVHLDQGLHAFLREEWVALSTVQQTLYQWHEADVVSQQGTEELLGGSRRFGRSR